MMEMLLRFKEFVLGQLTQLGSMLLL